MRTDDIIDTKHAHTVTPMCAAAYTSSVRIVAGLLATTSGASLLGIAALIVVSNDPVNPLRLIRLFVALCAAPGLATLAIRRASRVNLRIDGGTLLIERARHRVEVPLPSITGVEPWAIPVPDSGVWLRLRSGRRCPEGIETPDPRSLIDTLVEGGGPAELRTATRHPSVAYATARSASRPRSWRGWLLTFPVFALVPTLPLFRVHQIIAYGGTFGEYYQHGLGAYASGLAIYWATLTIYLLLYAAVLRVPVEVVSIASSLWNPRRAPSARRLVDRAATVLYFAGVPMVVALRFVPW